MNVESRKHNDSPCLPLDGKTNILACYFIHIGSASRQLALEKAGGRRRGGHLQVLSKVYPQGWPVRDGKKQIMRFINQIKLTLTNATNAKIATRDIDHLSKMS